MGLLDYFRKPKETASQRADWLNTTVRQIAGAVQTQQLAGMQHAARSFAAAETPAWVENWPTTAGAINDDLARQLPTLRARARAMSRNDEWAIGYMLRLDDGVLGDTGMPLQMRLKRRDDVEILDARPFFTQASNGALIDLGNGPFVQLWPHVHGTDGMFFALLRRR